MSAKSGACPSSLGGREDGPRLADHPQRSRHAPGDHVAEADRCQGLVLRQSRVPTPHLAFPPLPDTGANDQSPAQDAVPLTDLQVLRVPPQVGEPTIHRTVAEGLHAVGFGSSPLTWCKSGCRR